MYGEFYVWGVHKSFNLIYLLDQNDNINTRRAVTQALLGNLGYVAEYSSARRVGKKTASESRSILINLKNYQDVEYLLQCPSPYKFQVYEDKSSNDIDIFHTSFCKKSLNVSKYASNLAVLGELGRYPLSINCIVQVIKYWIRLSNGTKNDLLNSAYKMSLLENHTWVQSVYFSLCKNGFRWAWINPPETNKNFHVLYKESLRDQFIQNWRSSMCQSTRFQFLKEVKEQFCMSKYIELIKDPEIRLTLTRLRIDNNLYSDYIRSKTIGTNTCPMCHRGEDSLSHLLFKCDIYKDRRTEFEYVICQHLPYWPSLDISKKYKILLDLQCPDDIVHKCITFVHRIYTERELRM